MIYTLHGWRVSDDLKAPVGSIKLVLTDRETGEIYSRYHHKMNAAIMAVGLLPKSGANVTVKAYRILSDDQTEVIVL